MRRKKDRSKDILDIVTKEKKVEVAALARLLDVSQVTIRKDLDLLEERGIIRREHGYATLQNQEDMGTRIAIHYDEKYKIASKACELVHDGDTIMIESGSCCTLLADILTQKRKNLTLITNSAFIANYIRNKSNFTIILLGGIYQQSSQVMVGPQVRNMVRYFNVPKFFIGTDGYSTQSGFTNSDPLRAEAVRNMAEQAEEIIVLTESEKFDTKGIIPLHLPDPKMTVITDDKEIDPAILRQFEKDHIELIQAN